MIRSGVRMRLIFGPILSDLQRRRDINFVMQQLVCTIFGLQCVEVCSIPHDVCTNARFKSRYIYYRQDDSSLQVTKYGMQQSRLFNIDPQLQLFPAGFSKESS